LEAVLALPIALCGNLNINEAVTAVPAGNKYLGRVNVCPNIFGSGDVALDLVVANCISHAAVVWNTYWLAANRAPESKARNAATALCTSSASVSVKPSKVNVSCFPSKYGTLTGSEISQAGIPESRCNGPSSEMFTIGEF
jgi:hypothetical protein